VASGAYAKAKGLLETEVGKIWFDEPADVKNLSKVLGAFEQNGSVKIYADAETRGLADIITRLRAIHDNKTVDTKGVSLVAGEILAAYAEQWPRYYQFKEISRVLDEVATCLKQPLEDAQELDEVLKLALRYVYRVCFWVDTEIPWKDVTDLFR
jgi:hypothetical protein